MTRDEAKLYILDHYSEYLTPDKSNKGFICPICGSGNGRNGTGITENKQAPGHFTCWAGCFTNADIIEIIGKVNGLTDYNEILAEACRIFNITIDNKAGNQKPAKSEQNTHTHNNIHTYTQDQEEDYTAFFKECNAKLERTTYRRGISLETLNRFLVGYCEAWKHPKAPNAPASPRLIIPTSKHSYLARDTRENLDAKQQNYSKSKVGHAHIFNLEALETATKPIIIVEGEIDALSVIDGGGEAIGLGSVNNYKALLSRLKSVMPKAPLIISLDNDKAGLECKSKLEQGLKEAKIDFYDINIAEGYKDANEALQADREAFKACIYYVNKIEEWKKAEALERLQSQAISYSLDKFLENVKESTKAHYIPTGFKAVDNLLDGGLYPGLYIVGAVSSLGKTTFALQIADNIAKTGHSVLIYSLEMARDELIAKSLSRLTVIEDLKKHTTSHAKTTRGILTGSRYKNYSQEEKGLIDKAVAEYRQYASNIYISEGVGNIGVENIREQVEEHTRLTGKAPVVIIDYLQILAPYSERMTDKQNTDKAVLELKRLSRDNNIAVIGISSFNRDNYSSPVNLASFKESGAIEYSSDVLIALQYSGMDYEEGETEKAREKRIRELIKTQQAKAKDGKAQLLQVKILKNRNGSKGESLINFYPMFNYFTEEAPPVLEEVEESEWKEVNPFSGVFGTHIKK